VTTKSADIGSSNASVTPGIDLTENLRNAGRTT
jgi:hypothetical protein